MTDDREFLLPCVFVPAGGAIAPLVRPPTVAAKQSCVNEINSRKLFAAEKNDRK